MSSPPPTSFLDAIAACLAGGPPPEQLRRLVAEVLAPPAHAAVGLGALQGRVEAALGPGGDELALVYGGATKIGAYVFEAPQLQEIRGASGLLDYVTTAELPRLWPRLLAPAFDEELASGCVVFAGGARILGLAPRASAAALAEAIERAFAEWTLTCTSAAVALPFGLLELRYGRRPLAYTAEQFVDDWRPGVAANELAAGDRLRRRALAPSYGLDPLGDYDRELLAARFRDHKGFGELVALLAAAFARRRAERVAPLYAQNPWSARCDSSGTRPAVFSGPPIGDEVAPRELSEASARKRFFGQLLKGYGDDELAWFDEAFAWSRPATVPDWPAWRKAWRAAERQAAAATPTASWERRWQAFLAAHPETPYAREQQRIVERYKGRDVGPFAARDVHAIGAASRRYIGMVYADGNGVGRLLRQCATPEAFRALSTGLADAATTAVFTALAAHLRPARILGDEPRYAHPFEILTIGGDDILLIVPADSALDVALAIAHHFEQHAGLRAAARAARAMPDAPAPPDRYCGPPTESVERFGGPRPPVTLSAGVVIAQETAPIFFLRRLVEELKGSAKQQSRALHGGAGAVDFAVLKSITMVTDTVAAFRAQALGDRDVRKVKPDELPTLRRLTARPYTWRELAGLLTAARALNAARVPRSQLYRIREVLAAGGEGDLLASVMEYLYTRVRLSPAQGNALLQHVDLSWRTRGSAAVGSGAPPWLRRSGPAGEDWGWETVWADLVEIAEMVS